MQRAIRRFWARMFRPTVETVCALLVFGLVGIVLTGLWTLDHQPLRRGGGDRKWKYGVVDDADDDYSPRLRVRREHLDRFMRDRDQLRQEMARLKQQQAEYDDGGHEEAVREDDDEINTRRNAAFIERTAGIDAKLRKPTVGRSASNSRNDSIIINNTIKRKRKRKSFDAAVAALFPVVDGMNRKLNSSSTRLTTTNGRPPPERRWCSVLDTRPELSDVGEFEFDCIRLRIKPPTTICLYADDDDVHVSRHLREDGLWEPHEVRLFQNLLFQNPDLAVIDIGAQIGEYSLLAASMGRQVVAVEPLKTSIRRLHRAIKIGHLEDKIVLVTNPVSDARGEYIMDVPDGNQGGASLRYQSSMPCDDDECALNTSVTIVMDDLVEVVNFSRAVMKIDIEGHEHRAFAHADKLFAHVQIPYIFMEWIKMRAHYGAEVDDTDDKRRVQRLVDWFDDHGYVAYSLVLIQRLNVDYWYGWPDDIIWQHADAHFF